MPRTRVHGYSVQEIEPHAERGVVYPCASTWFIVPVGMGCNHLSLPCRRSVPHKWLEPHTNSSIMYCLVYVDYRLASSLHLTALSRLDFQSICDWIIAKHPSFIHIAIRTATASNAIRMIQLALVVAPLTHCLNDIFFLTSCVKHY